MLTILKAQKDDLKTILELQYLAYQSEAKLFNDTDIPPLRQTIEEVENEFQKGIILKAKEWYWYKATFTNRERISKSKIWSCVKI